MDTRNDYVKLFQDAIRIIKLATRNNVRFGSTKNFDLDTLLQGRNLIPLPFQTIYCYSTCIERSRRMVCNSDVLHPHRLSRIDHLFQSVFAVRVGRVTVHHAFDVVEREQIFRKFSGASGFNLTMVLPQLWRYVLHIEPAIYLCFTLRWTAS